MKYKWCQRLKPCPVDKYLEAVVVLYCNLYFTDLLCLSHSQLHFPYCEVLFLLSSTYTYLLEKMSEIRRKLVIVGDGACGKVRSFRSCYIVFRILTVLLLLYSATPLNYPCSPHSTTRTTPILHLWNGFLYILPCLRIFSLGFRQRFSIAVAPLVSWLRLLILNLHWQRWNNSDMSVDRLFERNFSRGELPESFIQTKHASVPPVNVLFLNYRSTYRPFSRTTLRTSKLTANTLNLPYGIPPARKIMTVSDPFHTRIPMSY